MNTTKTKENAYIEFLEMIEKSWTYERLTETEKVYCIDVLYRAKQIYKIDRGSYLQRWQNFQAVYLGFLAALGYTDNPTNWRNPDAETPTF